MTKAEQISWYKTFDSFRKSRIQSWTPKIYKELISMIKSATNESSLNTAMNRISENVRIDNLAAIIQNIYVDAGKVMGGKAYQLILNDVKNKKAKKSVKRESSLFQFEGEKYDSNGQFIGYRYKSNESKKIIIPKKNNEFKRMMPIGYNEELIQQIIQYFQLNLLEKAVFPISQTMKEWILKEMIAGQEEGKSLQQIADEIVKADFPKNRAILITRTEVLKASNYGSIQGAKKAGYKSNKIWIASKDFRTRRIPRDGFSHIAMDGITIDIDEPFHVPSRNGGYENLMQPGDPNGSKADIIQCFLPNEKTSINHSVIKKAFRNWYNGEVVTIQLASGNKFTVTINHPILTINGWVKAGNLTNGNKLIKSNILNKVSPKLNVNNIPSTFKEVFNSLFVHGMSMRQSSLSVNFYGDIPASNVDIINMKMKLFYRFKSFRFKNIISCLFIYTLLGFCFLFSTGRFNKNVFKKFFRLISDSYVSSIRILFSYFWWSKLHSRKHRFASVSFFNSVFFKNKSYNMASASVIGSNLFDTITNDKRIDNILFRQFSKKPVFYDNTIRKENISNSIISDMKVPCNLLDIPARFIQFTNILSITRHKYSGFVYTFETDNQMYDAAGVIAKNCRCTLGFSAVRDKNGLPIRL